MRWFLVLLLLVGCVQTPSSSVAIDSLKTTCQASCGSSGTVTVALLANSTLYTTEDALCIERNNKLYCGTCICASEDAGRYGPAPAELAVISEQQDVTCTFTDTSTEITVVC